MADDLDLFGEMSEADKATADAASARKVEHSTGGRSQIVFDVKPWDDETDMVKMEEEIRKIQMPGLMWGASKLEPVGFGIKKLVILCNVEDDVCSTDDLEEAITGLEDYVQSVDIASFNKL